VRRAREERDLHRGGGLRRVVGKAGVCIYIDRYIEIGIGPDIDIFRRGVDQAGEYRYGYRARAVIHI